mmetsp:Transcript_59525/g.132543  ORF Transcript_59525/g.132543 Transcript_59525/m.132543 type:complete len:204 (-) Transcript_59525:99-710(-)
MADGGGGSATLSITSPIPTRFNELRSAQLSALVAPASSSRWASSRAAGEATWAAAMAAAMVAVEKIGAAKWPLLPLLLPPLLPPAPAPAPIPAPAPTAAPAIITHPTKEELTQQSPQKILSRCHDIDSTRPPWGSTAVLFQTAPCRLVAGIKRWPRRPGQMHHRFAVIHKSGPASKTAVHAKRQIAKACLACKACKACKAPQL